MGYKEYLNEIDRDIDLAYEKYLINNIFKVNKRFTEKKNLKIQKIKLNEKFMEEKFMEEKMIQEKK